jgi:chemotaxis protein methyltransferase CheR
MMMMCASLTDEQFARARRLALQLAGIELVGRHRELLERRIDRLVTGEAFDLWLGAAEDGEQDARRRLVELLTTNFTGFFRHARHFDLAAEHALWIAHRRGRARLWSAAAATGEEPYSLAMALIDAFRREDPAATILATDIDETALAVARDATYDEAALGTLPPARHAPFVGEPVEGGRRRLTSAVRRLVQFGQLNLTDVAWPFAGPFDVVFCRNVLLYLEACHRYAVLERIASMLEPGGLLLLDPSEHVGGAAPFFVDRGGGVYSRRRRAGHAAIASGSPGR